MVAPSDPNPISSCCLTSDGKVVFVGCYDNVIYRLDDVLLNSGLIYYFILRYSYSVTNACICGRIQAHDDSVSALDLSIK